MTIQYLTPTPRSKMTKNRRTGIFLDRKGVCWRCRNQIRAHVEKWFIEHPDCLELGGSDNDADLWPAHVKCKPEKDAEDAAKIAERNTFLDKNCADRPMKSRPMPGTKASGLRKRMDGTVERR